MASSAFFSGETARCESISSRADNTGSDFFIRLAAAFGLDFQIPAAGPGIDRRRQEDLEVRLGQDDSPDIAAVEDDAAFFGHGLL